MRGACAIDWPLYSYSTRMLRVRGPTSSLREKNWFVPAADLRSVTSPCSGILSCSIPPCGANQSQFQNRLQRFTSHLLGRAAPVAN